MFTLSAKVRSAKENLSKLRKGGFVPAVYYGKKEQSTPISVEKMAFKKIWKEAGESSIITLTTEAGSVDSLLYEVQVDVVTGEPLHADFYTVDANTEIHANIPLEFVGTSPAVKDLGGILVKVMHEIEVKSLPKDLPPKIEVDISSLAELNSHITVADLKLPHGVSTTENATEIVALVDEAKEEVEEAPVAPIDLTQIEVMEKGKKEEEGEGEANVEAPAKEAKKDAKKGE
ncbi:50S ribosomal protein L25 [Candidatus Parcubacteria bacterium]|nr:50S ribosomal protein L25 [Candidatus Parcubacteria bacterium]